MNDFSVFIEMVDDWAWIGWLVLVALFLVIEMLTLDFTFLMLGVGSGVGLITDLAGVPLWVQVIAAAAAAALLILLLRPPLLRRLRRGEDPTRSNLDALIELPGVVLHEVSATAGQVKLSNGDTWSARTAGGFPLPPGAPIAITAIDGATVIVRPAND